jgi:hypothetical protein
MVSATRTVLSCVLLRADAAVAVLTTPLPLTRVPSALPGTLDVMICFSARRLPLELRLRQPHWSLRDRPRRRVSAVTARRHHRTLSRPGCKEGSKSACSLGFVLGLFSRLPRTNFRTSFCYGISILL